MGFVWISEHKQGRFPIWHLLTYSMQHSPSWEANRFSASQIPSILWNPKFHYRSQNSPPSVPIPSQIVQVQNHTSHFLKILLNLILPSTPGSPNWSLSFRFPHQNPVYASPNASMRVAFPAHLNLPDFITRKLLSEVYRSLRFSLCSSLHSPLSPRPY